MMIVEVLNSRSNNGNMASKLLLLLNEVCEHATQHLKLVLQQLPEFDIHDASHSGMVVHNMESLLRDKVDELSIYELFLLQMSGFLHDCAMALPAWELNLLKMTEGIGEFVRNDLGKSYANDGNPPYKLSSAIQLIETHKPQLYEDFEKVSTFIFSSSSESEMQRDLAERLIDYQEFRNGYTDELKKKALNGSYTEFFELSDLIRYEFTRQTHPQRVEKYIRNLASLFEARLGGVWGDKLANDLARICRSHGESMNYVKTLEEHTAYHGPESANLQFVAVLLRLADILHFSHDRAPQSLFIEKMIRSKESLLHWKVKFQGINYSLDESDANGRIKIKYMAYCDEPSLYYFIQEYLDWVDVEIDNYFRLIHGMEYSVQTRHLAERYRLNIANTVDRSQVQYDNSKFTPVPDMKFTLEQNKILELLMGVGLYKNKFLCLRELYQNALDACRCMMAIYDNQSVGIRGKIEFGLGISKEGGRQRTYIYCLDNGVGMNKHQITNFFLKIGNSFYKSKEFQKQNALLNSSFKPTSQFGIGILSCFMVGDKLEVTTRSLAVDGTTSEQPIRFSIDGPHEKFYYMTPDALDLEKLGRHGTLIKVYLSDDVIIYDHKIDELQLVIHGSKSQEFKQSRPAVYEKWDSHIYNLISSSLAIPKEDVDVLVAINNGTPEKVIPWGTPINLKDYPSEDLKLIYSEHRYLSDGYKVLDDYLKVRDFINLQEHSIRVEDIEYRFLLSLPLPGMPEVDYRVLSFQPVLYRIPNVLVDGVVVEIPIHQFHDVAEIGTINFVGMERPQLSVDRNSITNIPQGLDDSISKLPENLASTVVLEISKHIEHYNLKSGSPEVKKLWNYIFHKFHKFSNWLISQLAVIPEANMILDDISLFREKQVSVGDIIDSQNLVLKRFDSRLLEPTGELVFLGKIVEASNIEVKDIDVRIESSTFRSVTIPMRHFGPDQTLPLVVRADKWEGEYSQYDLVSGLWPIISPSLYDSLLYGYETTEISSKMKAVADHSNSISGLAGIDPAQIHQRLGMFMPERDVFNRKQNLVKKFDRSVNKFWLQELNQHGELIRKHKQDFILFGFISPRQLSEEELISLEDIKDEDPIYYDGAQNGWSFLILGKTSDFVILPGVVDRASILAAIKPSFWKKSDNIQYLFTDGTVLEPAQ